MSLGKLLVEASEDCQKLRHTQHAFDKVFKPFMMHIVSTLQGISLLVQLQRSLEVYACQVLTVYWLASGNEIPWCRASEMRFF